MMIITLAILVAVHAVASIIKDMRIISKQQSIDEFVTDPRFDEEFNDWMAGKLS